MLFGCVFYKGFSIVLRLILRLTYGEIFKLCKLSNLASWTFFVPIKYMKIPPPTQIQGNTVYNYILYTVKHDLIYTKLISLN